MRLSTYQLYAPLPLPSPGGGAVTDLWTQGTVEDSDVHVVKVGF